MTNLTDPWKTSIKYRIHAYCGFPLSRCYESNNIYAILQRDE